MSVGTWPSQLREMLAACATWQAVCGGASVALERINFLLEEGETVRPLATIMTERGIGYQLASGGDQNYLTADGNLLLVVELPAEMDAAFGGQNTNERAVIVLGKLLDELAALSGADKPGSAYTYLPLSGLRLLEWSRTPLEMRQSGLGDFHLGVFVAEVR